MLIRFQKMLKKKKKLRKVMNIYSIDRCYKGYWFSSGGGDCKVTKISKKASMFTWTSMTSCLHRIFFARSWLVLDLKKPLVLNTPVHSNVRLIFLWPASCTIQVFTSVLDCFSRQHLVTNSLTYNEQDIRIQFSHLSEDSISSWSQGTRISMICFFLGGIYLCKVITCSTQHLIV